MALRTRLTVAFVLVVLVPLLVGAALLVQVLPQVSQDRQAEGLAGQARAAAAAVAVQCQRARAAAEAAARASVASTPAQARSALAGLVDRGLADGVRVTGPSGITLQAGAVPASPADCAGPSVAEQGPVVTAVVPLRTTAGREGAAVAAVRLDGAFLQQLQAAGGETQVALVAGQQVVGGARATAREVAAASASRGTAAAVDGRLIVLSPAAPGQSLGVLLVVPLSQGPSLLPVVLGVLASAVVLAAAIALVLARALTSPLEQLGEAAGRLAAGDLDTRFDSVGGDEVGRLAASFNSMAVELQRSVGALQASRAELQAGLERLGDTLSSTHDLDRILAVVLETAMATTRARAGMLLLMSQGRDELVLAASRGLDDQGVDTALRLPVGSGVTGRVALTGEPELGRTDQGLELGPGEPRATSVIAVPLKSGGTVIGVLDLFDRVGADGFDPEDVATIRAFASQATVAVDNVLKHEEAQRLSITDGLTGLWNYRYFTMTVGKEIERAARFARPLALLMVDVDLFKAVNDTHGHQRGDAVLVELAGRVRGQVRDVDTVARYGGEEVVVVLPETDEDGALHAAERICEAVRRRPFGEPGQVPVPVTVSVGVAVFPVDGATASVLLRRADEALYVAKRSGRDTWRLAERPSPAERDPEVATARRQAPH